MTTGLLSGSPLHRSPRILLAFWLPLALSWIMMSIAQPISSIGISRLPDAEVHLAAYGVTVDVALLLESPIIMLLSASVALTRDQASYRLLRRFVVAVSAILTALFALVAFTPLYHLVVLTVVGVPREVAAQARPALWVLLPWVGSIAWRRFHQGPLILSGATRLISYGTVMRLVTLSAVLAAGVRWPVLPGALLGALALSASVVVEAAVITLWALPVVRRLPDRRAGRLTGRGFLRFATPLATTDMMRTIARPVTTAGVARAVLPEISLGAWPVANGLIQLVSASVMAFQEMVVAVADDPATYQRVRRFVLAWGLGFTGFAAALAATPMLDLYLERVVHLPEGLRPHVVLGLRLLVPMPALYALRNLMRGALIRHGHTRPVQSAMATGLGTLAILLAIGVTARLPGVPLAALAVLTAQAAEVAVLLFAFRTDLRAFGPPLGAVRSEPNAPPSPSPEHDGRQRRVGGPRHEQRDPDPYRAPRQDPD